MPTIDNTCFIHATAVIIGDVTLGKHCGVFPYAVIRGDENTIVIGEGSNIQDGCIIHVSESSSCSIGANVSIGHGAVVHGATIEDNCIIGMHATVMNHAVVGSGSIIGAGALVTQDSVIPGYSLVVGVPAKVVKQDMGLLPMIQKNAETYRRIAQEHLHGKYPLYSP